MFGSMITWMNRKLAGPPRPSVAYLEDKLRGKCNAELIARLRNRARIHSKSAHVYLRECAVMDREAAHRMLMLERKVARLENRDNEVFEDNVRKMLTILEEPNEK